MYRSLHKFIILCWMICLSVFSFSKVPPNNHFGNRVRLHIGPAIGFYHINANHASDPHQRFSFLLGFSKEFRLGHDYQTYLVVGADFFHHGLNFNSYYFGTDSIHIYDKNFNYTYALNINELNLPIQFKYLFRREDNSVFSPYLAVGYHIRYLLPGKLNVTQDGNAVKEDTPDIRFKNSTFAEKLNAAVSLSCGWQKNATGFARSSFYAELNVRYGFSPYYFESTYSASSLYINSVHLTLQLGIKF